MGLAQLMIESGIVTLPYSSSEFCAPAVRRSPSESPCSCTEETEPVGISEVAAVIDDRAVSSSDPRGHDRTSWLPEWQGARSGSQVDALLPMRTKPREMCWHGPR